jgi:3-hydroxy-9,10-secoandrosta-1,3,5(10)-triene-9,17-dione monooxygenase reductase component
MQTYRHRMQKSQNRNYHSRYGIDTSEFRPTRGTFCTGVAIVTGLDRGNPTGFTMQSLVSLSLSPPLIGLSSAKTSDTWKRIRPSQRFCANILSREQADLCRTFATKGTNRFSGVRWCPSATDLSILDDVVAYVYCTLETEYEAGDHLFVVGRVEDLALLREQAKPCSCCAALS